MPPRARPRFSWSVGEVIRQWRPPTSAAALTMPRAHPRAVVEGGADHTMSPWAKARNQAPRRGRRGRGGELGLGGGALHQSSSGSPRGEAGARSSSPSVASRRPPRRVPPGSTMPSSARRAQNRDAGLEAGVELQPARPEEAQARAPVELAERAHHVGAALAERALVAAWDGVLEVEHHQVGGARGAGLLHVPPHGGRAGEVRALPAEARLELQLALAGASEQRGGLDGCAHGPMLPSAARRAPRRTAPSRNQRARPRRGRPPGAHLRGRRGARRREAQAAGAEREEFVTATRSRRQELWSVLVVGLRQRQARRQDRGSLSRIGPGARPRRPAGCATPRWATVTGPRRRALIAAAGACSAPSSRRARASSSRAGDSARRAAAWTGQSRSPAAGSLRAQRRSRRGTSSRTGGGSAPAVL